MSFSLRLLVCSVATTALLAVPALAKEAEKKTVKNTPEETYKMLQLFGDVFERVRTQYVDEVADKDLIEYAINGMLTSLDPHSSYMTAESFDDMKVQTRGSFGGLGIEVTMENGVVKVISPIDDTPAAHAGVKAGDFITHLDGKAVLGMTLNDAVDKMRGKVGTPIEVTIRREGNANPVKLRIVRDVIKIRSVRFSRFDDIGYIRITTFNQQTAVGLKAALEELQKADKKPIGYVLDLRNNPGGLLDQAIAVADDFLDKGEIVSTRGRNEEDTKRDNATKGELANNAPLVVLINGGSASAAEIVAGALQDNRRALVLGTKSFGKGSVQTIVSLPNNGALRLTTARYYTPSGRSIQAKGIEPDILVEQGKLEKVNDNGDMIAEADLKGALDGQAGKKHEDGTKPSAAEGETPAPADTAKDTGKDADKKDAKKDALPNLDHPDTDKDYQLARAIDMVRGLGLYGSQIPPKGTPTVEEALAKNGAKTEKGSDEKAPVKP